MLHGCGTILVCLFYAIAIVFQLYHGGDMMYYMRRRRPEPSFLPTQCLPRHIGMVLEAAFDDAISYYTQWGNGLQHS